MPAFDVEALRAEFPALTRQQDGRTVAYLDGPGGTQVPQRVIDTVTDYFAHSNANSGGAFTTSELSDAIADEAHAAVADFLGAASPHEIKFGYNMSTLTLHIGRSIGATLTPGDEIGAVQLFLISPGPRVFSKVGTRPAQQLGPAEEPAGLT